MFHDGSFDRLVLGQELSEEIENAPCLLTLQNRWELGGFRKPQTSAQLFGMDPGHNQEMLHQ